MRSQSNKFKHLRKNDDSFGLKFAKHVPALHYNTNLAC